MRHYRLVHSWPSRLRRTKYNLAYITSVFIGYIGTDSIGLLIKRFAAKKAWVEDEINNQRKAFLDMLAWSEGTDNGRQKTRNHGYDVIVGGELFTDYSDHPQTCHAKLKPNNRRRTLPASSPLVGCLPQAAWPERLLSEKSGRWHCSRLRSVALYLWLIRWYPSGNRLLQQYLGFTAGRWLWSVRA